MITVKLFGLLRLNSGIKELCLDARNVAQVKQALLARSEKLSRKDLDGCVILINDKPATKRSKLTDGDRVVFLSPVAGG